MLFNTVHKLCERERAVVMSIESVPPQSKLILSQILFWFDHIQSKLFNLTFDVFGFSLIELRIDRWIFLPDS